jgi:putative glutamine amidotransferase
VTESPLILMTLRGAPAREDRTDPTAFAFEWLPNAFAQVVADAGGVPVFVSSECPPDKVSAILRRCDGLFLTGGEDLAPEFLGVEDTVGNLDIYRIRDAVELAAVKVADELAMPILGVCRGAQVLNAARGGSLYLDLEQQYGKPLRDHSRGTKPMHVQSHAVTITPGSKLHGIVQCEQLDGATSHHQAIREPGANLTVVGLSPEDGVIEAIEESSDRFVVGVQWHPEVHATADPTQRLFGAFVKACAAYSSSMKTAG